MYHPSKYHATQRKQALKVEEAKALQTARVALRKVIAGMEERAATADEMELHRPRHLQDFLLLQKIKKLKEIRNELEDLT